MPYPSYSVTFEIPTAAPICFTVTLANNAQVPANVQSLVAAAIQSGFTGQDGGLRARIGSVIYASRYYADVAALGTWVNIVSILIGTDAVPTVSMTASITGSTLTVTAVASGTLAVGQFLYGVGLSPGTIITALGSGTGGTGTYTVGTNYNVTSEAITAVSASNNDVTMHINWLPTLQNADVNFVLV
jgi:hypothetical protein